MDFALPLIDSNSFVQPVKLESQFSSSVHPSFATVADLVLFAAKIVILQSMFLIQQSLVEDVAAIVLIELVHHPVLGHGFDHFDFAKFASAALFVAHF